MAVKKDAEERFIAIGVTFWKFYVVETTGDSHDGDSEKSNDTLENAEINKARTK